MLHYDPEFPPDPSVWLAAGEAERIKAAQTWHVKARVDLPSVKAHAALHAIIENQIAMGLEAVQRAIPRLEQEGLDRHDAIHAVAWVLSLHLHDLVAQVHPDDDATTNARYAATVERLTAEAWRKQESV